ncbi:P-loop containing nucleoside triphosphate hydrolase protein [Aspergillus heteromorphus CBS 117.55]|uniref:P-loop containing nucleoside triphosphate hydrolase protein n=1 Tax=Aspergillus heteromorphus CBS 117.55 TaxID=1448321 RepID=A0A317V7B5_9EURO|nr:P-loop containing nucleoside triphosphate hydrolase protein [Aspergillus heteromorphus CBS 117.55]PWY70243.1 P-loop containing nucleoside triphosphate hydrolase protein [Aspergillus heteromorphus CBS 117.55]
MVLAKSKNSVGLGNSLMNDRFGKGKASGMKKASHNASIARKNEHGETYITNAPTEAAWVKMRSITEQAALDEFLSTAELAGTDFTAEKMNNVKIIHTDQKNPFLLSASEEKSAVKKHQKNRDRLTVPRRPKWDQSTTRQQLELMERESFLNWRRGLAELQENHDLLMTPFERNLEVWRQLWRVIERSDLVVQIVDARNPLLFRSEDLEAYVKEISPKKRNLLLVNKADMLTDKQRAMWADYFERHNIEFRFFSAHLAKEHNERLMQEEEERNSDSEESDEEDVDEAEELAEGAKSLDIKDGKKPQEPQEEHDGGLDLQPGASSDPRTDILDVEQLEELFLFNSPENLPDSDTPEGAAKQKTVIGLVGYPNVGKSSTINALLGAKKVSVSATPGKTKHFQTLYLSPEIMLCDCPGLVFANFATTKAELVVNGVLPIDQQREFTGPAGLVAHRIPKHFLENVYGVTIRTRPVEEGGTGIPNASEVLRAYARARGFATSGLGQPDESRAARYVLKDYVNGKLLFCHPPPQPEGQDPIDPHKFNEDLYDMAHLPPRRQAMLAKLLADEALAAGVTDPEMLALLKGPVPGLRSRNLDSGFFGPENSASTGRLTLPFNSQYTEQGKEMRQHLTGRKERMMVALERGVDVSEVRSGSSKKHFKANKRRAKKVRKNAQDEDY